MLTFDKLKNCKDMRAKETVDFYLSQAEDQNLCLFYAVTGDVLLLMGQDEDGVVFFPPEALSDTADTKEALSKLDDFAGAACIHKIFVGVDEEWEDILALRYPHHEIFDMGDGFSAFRVCTELHSVRDFPAVRGGKVTLRLPSEGDEAFFAALREESENSLYGYETERDDLLAEGLEEWEKRQALPLVIEWDDRPAGELTLFSFDGRKTAKIAVRILSSYRKRGIAKEALKEAVAIARDTLCLSKLKAEVKTENEPSLRLFSSLFIKDREEDGVVYFQRNL